MTPLAWAAVVMLAAGALVAIAACIPDITRDRPHHDQDQEIDQ